MTEPSRCERGHQWIGTSGIRIEDGVHAEHLPPADTPADGNWARHHRELVRRHVACISRYLDTHPPKLRDWRHLERLLDLVERARQLDERLLQQSSSESHYPLSDQQIDKIIRISIRKIYPRLVDIEHVGEAVQADSPICAAVYSEANIVGTLLSHPARRRAVLQALVRHRVDDPELHELVDAEAEDDAAEYLDLLLDDEGNEVIE